MKYNSNYIINILVLHHLFIEMTAVVNQFHHFNELFENLYHKALKVTLLSLSQ